MNLKGHVALYGGSFNPPHMGHQLACLYALEALSADAVWLLPAWVHPFGKPLADFEHRVEMCKLLAAPLGPRIEVSTVERDASNDFRTFDRGRTSGDAARGRTFDTLVLLKSRHQSLKFALLIGADILADTRSWHRWDDIVSMVEVVVLGRRGYDYAEPEQTPVQLPEVSSSDIRRRLAAGDSIAGLVPAAIEAYIASHQLF